MTGMDSADCASTARPTLATNRQTARWRLGRNPVIISIDKLPFVDRRNHFHLQARSDLNLFGCLANLRVLRGHCIPLAGENKLQGSTTRSMTQHSNSDVRERQRAAKLEKPTAVICGNSGG